MGTPRGVRVRAFRNPPQGSLPTGRPRDYSACPPPPHNQTHCTSYIPKQVALKLQRNWLTVGPRRAHRKPGPSGMGSLPLPPAVASCPAGHRVQTRFTQTCEDFPAEGMTTPSSLRCQPQANTQTHLEFQHSPSADQSPTKTGLVWSSEQLSAAGAE